MVYMFIWMLGDFLSFINLGYVGFGGPFQELPMLDQDFIEKLHYEFGSSSGAKCTRWIKSMDFYHIQLKCITTTVQHKLLKSQFDYNSCVKFNFISLYCLDINVIHLFIMSRHEYHVHYL